MRAALPAAYVLSETALGTHVVIEPKRQIIAMGGGGFSMEPDNLALDAYVVNQARRKTPSVCFVGTASGDAETYIVRFYTAFSQLECRPTHLRFFDRTPDLQALLLTRDVIYVGGGNTKSLPSSHHLYWPDLDSDLAVATTVAWSL